MTDSNTVDGWFDDANGRSGAASFNFGTLGDSVVGEVVDQFKIPYVKFENRKLGTVEKDKDGNDIEQLVIVLQTELRGWAGVKNIPTDGDDKPKPPEADDGKRAIYVRKYTNLHGAIGDMLKAAREAAGDPTLKVVNGGKLGVQFFDQEDTGKGNPLKKYRGKYTPPAPAPADDSFFDKPSQVGGQPAATPPAQPSAPAQPAPAQDPWSGAAVADEPPF